MGGALGLSTNLVMMEENVWDQTILTLNYSGILEAGWGADYDDPNSFFAIVSRGEATDPME
jgi:ABC-type oligopeptide transport system substrate-binding subunit